MVRTLRISILLLVSLCSIAYGRRKDYSKERPDRNLCTIEENAAMHCFCDSEDINNATKVNCVIFKNLAKDDKIWNIFNTQINMEKLTITVRPDQHLYTVPTKALRHLRRMKYLEMKYASMTDIHSYAFANLSTVVEIMLPRNKIETLKPYSLAHLHSLETLTLDENRIAELERNVFVDLPNLRKLFIAQNNLSVVHDGAFKHLGALHELELDRNSLSIITRDTFAGLSSLKRLDLSGNRLTLLGDLTFAELWSLESLLLDSNSLQQISERAFDGLIALRRLTLSRNRLRVLRGGLLDGASTVNNLDLRGNQLQTLTYDNVRPILENLRNDTSYLHIEQNKFICDCRLSWMHQLRNTTKNERIRNALEEVTCFMDLPEHIDHIGNLETHHKNDLLSGEEGNSLTEYGADYIDGDYDEDHQKDSATMNHHGETYRLKHLFEIPMEALPCPEAVKGGPTAAPNSGLITPGYNEANAAFSQSMRWRTSYMVAVMVVIFQVVLV